MNTPVRLLAFLAMFSIPSAVFGHGYLKTPRSRNFAAYQDGRGEYEPWSANRKAFTETCGTIGGRNYDFLPSGVQATYSSGQTVDFDIEMTAHHKGHFVLKACPISPGQTATQACFDRNPLRFVSGENANPHPSYPDRAYLPPANSPNAPNGRWSYRYKFQLPQGLSGDLVLLQWHYITANSCLPPGYNTYSWPAGWNPGNLATCVDIPADGAVGGNRPEQFWNCAEVRITNGAPPTPTPPTNGGTCGGGNRGNGVCANGQCCSRYGWCGTTSDHCTGVPPPTPTPPPVGGGTCGGGNRGNGVCADGQCCSRYGWCGRTPDHCAGVPPPAGGGSLGDWTVCSSSSQCRNGCCSGTYSGGVFKCTPLNGGFNPSICRAG